MAFCPPQPGDQSVVELKENEIDRDSFIFSTACWPQYVGTWEIKDDRFYLVNLTGRFKLVESSPVLADWFTGVLRIPQGERLHYVHMGFGSVYGNELHIKIDHGVVVKSVTIDNRNKDFVELNIGFGNLPGFENNFDRNDI